MKKAGSAVFLALPAKKPNCLTSALLSATMKVRRTISQLIVSTDRFS
jgi:hypothetical protein